MITASRDYADSGALLTLLPNAEGKIDLVVNLKHNEHMHAQFTDAFIQENGITEVIQ